MVRSLRGGGLCLDPTSVAEKEIWFSSRQTSHATCKPEVGFRNNLYQTLLSIVPAACKIMQRNIHKHESFW